MRNNLFTDAGISLESGKIQAFEEYRTLILGYNKIMDITNITDEEDMYIKHFIDSLYLDKSGLISSANSLIDIGTGGGFPGIPLKILYPHLELTLLDSLNKRVNFLTDVIDQMKLDKTKAIHGRAEELARNPSYREMYDLATSRAVAPLNTLIEYSLAFVKIGGYFIAMKGPNYDDELSEARDAINTMGGMLKKVVNYSLPYGYGDRSIIIIEKIKSTPTKYPRGQGKPRKKPL